MTHQRITYLRFRPGADWSDACERVAARAAGAPNDASLQVVRVDAEHAVVIASAADREALVRVDELVLAPWLAELPLAEPHSTVVGETEWALARADPWSHIDALDEVARCEHFVHHVAEAGAAWGLYDKTWARSAAAAGREALPLWPQRELAARCVAGPWRTFVPRAIDGTALLEQWLTGMQEDGIVAVITPTPGDPGVVLEPDVLADALRRVIAH